MFNFPTLGIPEWTGIAAVVAAVLIARLYRKVRSARRHLEAQQEQYFSELRNRGA